MQKLLDVVPEGKVADEAREPETAVEAGGAVVDGRSRIRTCDFHRVERFETGHADAGEVDGGEGDAEPPLADFWSQVRRGDGCWEWGGSRLQRGYGQFGRTGLAHRISWEMVHGPVPDGLCVLHRCDNPPCVRPDHLWLGTRADNNRDKADKGRAPWGERAPAAKLTAEQVRTVRSLLAAGDSLSLIARRFGVSHAAIWSIHVGRTWRRLAAGRAS